jgi:hypothetical protein
MWCKEADDAETPVGHTSPSCSEEPSRKRGRPRKVIVSSSDTDDLSIHDNSVEDGESNFEEALSKNVIEMQNLQDCETQNLGETLKEGGFFVVKYDRQLYHGLMVNVPSDGGRGPAVD